MRCCRHKCRVLFYLLVTTVVVLFTSKPAFINIFTSTTYDADHNLESNHVHRQDSSYEITQPPRNNEKRVIVKQTDEHIESSVKNAEEESRRFRQLLRNSRDTASPPELTKVNCAEVVHNLTVGEDAWSVLTNTAGSVDRETRTTRSMGQLWERTENCTRYALSSGFLFADVSEEELSFPLAFSILVYKDLDQVERLLRAVYRPHNLYCLHADSKASGEFHRGLRQLAACLPNVGMAQHSSAVTWGTISVLEPEIQCMRDLLSRGTRWRYFINLTGQEFPLKTNQELVRILRALKGANVITGARDKSFDFRWQNSKPVPYNLTMTKGDVHIIASRQYVDYVINSRVARELYTWLKDSFIPDESFFSTLNYNPQLGIPGSFTGPVSKLTSQAFRSLKLWQFDPSATCHGQWKRTICHFGVGDLPALISSPSLIANKFTYGLQPLAYDCVERWYFDKVRQEKAGEVGSLDMSLYERSPFVLYRYTGPVLVWG